MNRRVETPEGPVELSVVDAGGVSRVALRASAGPERVLTARRVEGPRGAIAVDVGHRRLLIWTHGAQVSVLGRTVELPEARRAQRGKEAHGGSLASPMPGTVLDVRVKPGDAVDKGQVLVVIEAMKMEHSVTAPRAGRIEKVFFAPGARCGLGDTLVELSS